MGANVSTQGCQARFNITLNCTATPGQSWGNVTRGQFEPDPDIAGIGVRQAPATDSWLPAIETNMGLARS